MNAFGGRGMCPAENLRVCGVELDAFAFPFPFEADVLDAREGIWSV